MARIAWFSPLPPNPSGISDYSAVILPPLAARHQIDLYYDRRWPSLRTFLPELKRYPIDEFIWRNLLNGYDLPVYQMGNSLHHAFMHPLLYQYPGLLVLHDLVMHHARGHILLAAGRQNEYRDELEYCHRGCGRQIGDILAHIPSDFTCYQFPMNRLMVDYSLATAVHTAYGVSELCDGLRQSPVFHVHHPRFPESEPRPDLVERFAISDSWPVLACFGLITKEKRIEECLRALRLLSARFPRIRLLLVGGHPRHFNPRRLIRELRIADHVTITGRVDEATFNALFHAATIVLNLRYPSAREMSGTLLRALGAGKVTFISEQIHLLDIPTDIAPRIPLFDEAEAIAESVTRILEDPNRIDELGRRAREFVEQAHSVASSAAEYETAIAAALDARATWRPPENAPAHLRPLADRLRACLPEGIPLEMLR